MSYLFTVKKFPCPKCGDTGTIAELATESDLPVDAVPAMSYEVTFLKQPTLAGVSVPALIAYYDLCTKCGTKYCKRVEKRNIPVTGQLKQNQPFGGFPPFRNG